MLLFLIPSDYIESCDWPIDIVLEVVIGGDMSCDHQDGLDWLRHVT